MAEDVMEMLIGATGETVKRDDDTSRSHMVAGENAERVGDRIGAVNEYRKALQFNTENVDAAFRLAYCLDLVGESDEAISLYEHCIDVGSGPAHINALVNLAICYDDQGSYRRAEKCLRQVLDTEPNHPRAKLFMKDIESSFDMEIDEDAEKNLTARSALLETPVTDFELSVRARNCLKKMSINTLGDLLRITEAELLGSKNFGETSLQEVKDMLATKGLRLGQGLEEQHDVVRRSVYEKLKGTPQEYMLSKPVSELQLSVRARKALQVLNISTIGDLCARTEAELLGVKNFGSTSLDEVTKKLGDLGLELRQLSPEEGGIPTDQVPEDVLPQTESDILADIQAAVAEAALAESSGEMVTEEPAQKSDPES
ncbi:MAG: hypothetical protein D8M59_07840 [Planctomycetes bacterium]|nr:hypothetical protein [Planctomycetota bacterium]NOG53235.1 tetratricopeptide repeat protein [Planctomycetota bacterium]